ncbi:DUF6276 family protein [Natrarchaeobius chitinivorans]|uniref:Small CPxCG-related zinc finger protein n=1 Tax=Natrarchaeobius chitinivorans TaxID=1679083 RepID=A0A3N6P5U6_NATCH|nr:DUF6276 family protein [Natrarchaeobius chitinivorans]RQG91035.1 hypothetical protein EA473_19000 [Natrarchaeobius chitinivorans]
MVCSTCDTPVISFSVPGEYREYVSDSVATTTAESGAFAAFCPRCLTLESAEGHSDVADSPPDEKPDFSRVSDAFPTNPDRAIPLAIALDLCSSLATNRSAIESLLGAVERAGTDPLLVIDRLEADPSVDPQIDLERRSHQLEQLLY